MVSSNESWRGDVIDERNHNLVLAMIKGLVNPIKDLVQAGWWNKVTPVWAKIVSHTFSNTSISSP